jgi:spermidine synthase
MGAVLVLLFGSGLSALVYQTAWQRMFRLVFGASTLASAAVLAVFLGGLGIGGALLGRRAEQSPRPLRFYGTLEIAIAAWAALTPLLTRLAGTVYFATGGSLRTGHAGATAIRLLLLTLVIGPAALLMGGTLPAAARAVETEDDEGRRRVAGLYAGNTFGAVAGALLGTFALFEALGTSGALYAAAGLNLVVGLWARLLGSRRALVAASPAPEPGEELPAGRRRVLYAAAAITGLVFLDLELVWYRMLSPILGGTSFTFGLILAVALAGIGVGGLLYGLGPRPGRPTLLNFALTAALEALLAGMPLWLGDAIAVYATGAHPMGALGFLPMVMAWTAVTMVVVFPAAVVAGYQFPLLFALLGHGQRDVSKQVGTAYAFNTAGSIAGSLLAGFVLIPSFGAVASWRIAVDALAALALLAALAGLALERRPPAGFSGWAPAAAASLVAGLAFLVGGASGPTAVWRHASIGAGRAEIAGLDRLGIRNWMHRTNSEVVWERDGVESSVALIAHGSYSFFINGKSDGSVSGDRGTQVMAGMLPALLHGAPKKAFVLGLGTGMTAGWLGQVPTMERVDVAEIEPAIADIARAASDANFAVLDQPKVHLFVGDGREFLLTTDERYDIIMSEPSNPYRAGVSSLFTEEFYQSVDRRLEPGGIFVQWLQGYQIDARTVRTVLRTLKRVMPHVEVWMSQESDFLFLASREARPIPVDAVRALARTEPYRTALLRTWLVEDVEGVLAHFVATDALVGEMAAGPGPANTDDDSVLEFAFARNTTRRRILGVESLLATSIANRADRPAVQGQVEWARMAELRGRALMRSARRPRLPLSGEASASRMEAVLEGCQSGAADKVLASWAAGGALPRDHIEIFVLARALAEKADDRATPLAAELQQAGLGAEAEYVRAALAHASGQGREAMYHVLAALAELRARPLSICGVDQKTIELIGTVGRSGSDFARRGAEALLAGPLASAQEDGLRNETARRLAFLSPLPLCVHALGKELEDPEWVDWLLKGRAKCLADAGHPLALQAAADVAEFMGLHDGFIEDALLVSH